MAKALICDVCGDTFAQTYSEGANGRWNKVAGEIGNKRVYIVYGTFTPPPPAKLARLTVREIPNADNLRGDPVDVCKRCTLTVISNALKKEFEATSNERVPEGGHEEHSGD